MPQSIRSSYNNPSFPLTFHFSLSIIMSSGLSPEVEQLLHPPPARFFLPTNPTLTQSLSNNEAYRRYMTWLDCFGALYPKLDFPVAFGEEGLVGVAAKVPIGPNEPLLHIPFSLCITYANARESELRPMLDAEEIFSEEEEDWLDFSLYAYLIREKIKGAESFFYPYFCTVEQPEMLMDWSVEELKELQDQFLLHKVPFP